MPLKQKFTIRLVICSAVVVYLLADLFVFHGPIGKRIDFAYHLVTERLAYAKSQRVVAHVYSQQITRGQLDRATHQIVWIQGKSFDSLSPEAQKNTRYAALDELIDRELLRVKTTANANDLSVTSDEIEKRMSGFAARFSSEQAMITAMKSQGIESKENLRNRITAEIQQEKYVATKIASSVTVSEEEAQDWFTKHQADLQQPERIHVRHVFLPSLEHSKEQATQQLQAALESLASNIKDFATLAHEISEDSATQNKAGDLGWISRNRMPPGITEDWFQLPTGKPTILESKLGWHLAEVTDRKPAEPRTYEQAKPEILAALETIKRQKATESLRNSLRQSEDSHIQIEHDMVYP
jgi:parvulin-like peptidyl-prolyl isomerase